MMKTKYRLVAGRRCYIHLRVAAVGLVGLAVFSSGLLVCGVGVSIGGDLAQASPATAQAEGVSAENDGKKQPQQQIAVERWEASPRVRLGDESFYADVLIPDVEKGHYRGPRFVHGGMVAEVGVVLAQNAQQQDRGNQVLESGVAKRLVRLLGECGAGAIGDPEHHDRNAVGLAEEFSIPLGYEFAQPGAAEGGDEFLKIGVGWLKKTKNEKYFFATPYPVVEALPWVVVRADRSVSMTQSTRRKVKWADEAESYVGYVYNVEVSVDVPGRRVVVSRTLSNTGDRVIDTSHYPHHFFQIDGKYPGRSTKLKLESDVSAGESSKLRDLMTVQGNVVGFSSDMPEKKSASAELIGLPQAPVRFWVIQEDAGWGGVQVEVDHQADLSSFYVWASDRVFCPEPYTKVRIEPGQQHRWSTTYQVQ